jgi:hypothetical protein
MFTGATDKGAYSSLCLMTKTKPKNSPRLLHMLLPRVGSGHYSSPEPKHSNRSSSVGLCCNEIICRLGQESFCSTLHFSLISHKHEKFQSKVIRNIRPKRTFGWSLFTLYYRCRNWGRENWINLLMFTMLFLGGWKTAHMAGYYFEVKHVTSYRIHFILWFKRIKGVFI